MMGDYCWHSILPFITADGEIAAKDHDPYRLKGVRALCCVNVADGLFTTGTSRLRVESLPLAPKPRPWSPCENSGHSPTAWRTGQIDPKATFSFDAMNGWEARESGRCLKARKRQERPSPKKLRAVTLAERNDHPGRVTTNVMRFCCLGGAAFAVTDLATRAAFISSRRPAAGRFLLSTSRSRSASSTALPRRLPARGAWFRDRHTR